MSTSDQAQRLFVIGHLTAVLREETLPEREREACLTIIGWLARRGPSEAPCQKGLTPELRRASQRPPARSR